MADFSVIEQVTQRGYTVLEFNNLMLKRIGASDDAAGPTELQIVAAGAERHAEWCRAVLTGFNGTPEVAEESLALLSALPSYGDTPVCRKRRNGLWDRGDGAAPRDCDVLRGCHP